MNNDRPVSFDEVTQELNRIPGLQVADVYDLVNTEKSYPQAIPKLVELLVRVSDPVAVEGIVRALTVPAAKGVANDALFRLFLSLPTNQSTLKWTIGNALKVVMLPEDFARAEAIVSDRAHGIARQEIVASLGKIRTPRSEEVLVSLLDDDEVAAHALEGLMRLRSTAGVPKARKLLQSSRVVVRKEAKKYLLKFEKPGDQRSKPKDRLIW